MVPYYGYAKQEKKTTGREPISAKLVANLITTAGARSLLTMDLHAPAIEGFFDIPVDHLQAGPLLVDYFRAKDLRDVVVGLAGCRRRGPRQQVSRAASAQAWRSSPSSGPSRMCSEVIEMVGDVDGKTAIIVDDMISTGGTLVEAAKRCASAARRVSLPAPRMASSRARPSTRSADSHLEEIVVTNTIPLPPEASGRQDQNDISVAALFAEAIMRIHKDLSLSTLFM